MVTDPFDEPDTPPPAATGCAKAAIAAVVIGLVVVLVAVGLFVLLV
jgi:hypothetical protein